VVRRYLWSLPARIYLGLVGVLTLLLLVVELFVPALFVFGLAAVALTAPVSTAIWSIYDERWPHWVEMLLVDMGVLLGAVVNALVVTLIFRGIASFIRMMRVMGR